MSEVNASDLELVVMESIFCLLMVDEIKNIKSGEFELPIFNVFG